MLPDEQAKEGLPDASICKDTMASGKIHFFGDSEEEGIVSQTAGRC